jgi:hypothetical protein
LFFVRTYGFFYLLFYLSIFSILGNIYVEFHQFRLFQWRLARPGLLGLVRNCLKAQWVFESGLLAVSTWADRVKRRGNGLQNRLALVKANFEDLHVPWKKTW